MEATMELTKDEQARLARLEARRDLKDLWQKMEEIAHALETELPDEYSETEYWSSKAWDSYWEQDRELAKELRSVARRVRKLADPRV